MLIYNFNNYLNLIKFQFFFSFSNKTMRAAFKFVMISYDQAVKSSLLFNLLNLFVELFQCHNGIVLFHKMYMYKCINNILQFRHEFWKIFLVNNFFCKRWKLIWDFFILLDLQVDFIYIFLIHCNTNFYLFIFSVI